MLVSTYYVSYYVKIVAFKANISVKQEIGNCHFDFFFLKKLKLVQLSTDALAFFVWTFLTVFPPNFNDFEIKHGAKRLVV